MGIFRDMRKVLRDLNNWMYHYEYKALSYFKNRHVSAVVFLGDLVKPPFIGGMH